MKRIYKFLIVYTYHLSEIFTRVCLLATRGRPKRQCAGIHQFVISHIEQHSKKPDEVRDKIVKLMGDQPRIELFARQQTPGWDVWGNEVESTVTMQEQNQ